MGKLPYFPFYPNDWSRDMEEHPLEIEGAWIRIVSKLWYSYTRGELARNIEQWATILRVSPHDANRILDYINHWKIGDVVTNGNGEITVKSRRMVRDEKERSLNALRQQRFKEKRKSNGPVTEKKRQSNKYIHIHSSVSSSVSSTKKKKIHIDFLPPTLEEVTNYCKERNNGIDPQAFIDHNILTGWTYGKQKIPITDWKAAVRTWEHRRKEKEDRFI